ncbi:MAG: AsmA family protein [Candidatus Magnetomorum sp.]|nr:AsmA family protein [Candidatus Magnetomorum sp.]
MKRFIKWLAICLIVIISGLGGLFIFLFTYDYNHLKPVIEKAVMDATGRKLSIQGNIHFYMGFTPEIRISQVRFENAAWSDQPHMLQVGQLQLEIQLWPLIKKIIYIKRFILEDIDLSIEINKNGTSNLTLDQLPTNQPTKQFPSSEEKFSISEINFQNVCLKTVRLAYQNAMEAKQMTLTMNQINVSATGLYQPVSVKAIGKYRNHVFDIQGSLGSINSLLDAHQNFPIDLSAKGGGMDVSLTGKIQDVLSFKGIELNAFCQGKQLETFLNMAGVSAPIDGPYHIQMAVAEQADHHYKAAVDLFLGNNTLKGLGELNLNRVRPGIKLVLEADTIDLRPFITSPPKNPPTDKDPDLFSYEQFLPDSFLNMDFISALRVHTLMTPRLAIHDLNTHIRLTPTSFTLKPFSASIGGGTIKGNLNIENGQKKGVITATVETSTMNIGQMLKELAITEIFDGSPDIKLSLNTQGHSTKEWMIHLNGHIIVQMGEGKIYNKYINMFGGELSSNVIRLINPMKTNNYSLVQCMVCRFDINDGLADATMMMLDSDQMRIVGAGKVDFGKETIDISIKPLPKSGLNTGRLGKFSLSLSELSEPFKLGGTFKNPHLKMDLTKAAWTIGKAVGGMILFGPAGIAAALISGVASNEQNACELAKEVARTGKYPVHPSHPSVMKRTQQSVQKGFNDVGKHISDTWNQLFDKK